LIIGVTLGVMVLHRHWVLSGLEMLFVAGIAFIIVYGIGYLIG